MVWFCGFLLQGPTPSVSKDVKDEDSALRLFILCRLSPLTFSFLCWPLRRMKFIYLVLVFFLLLFLSFWECGLIKFISTLYWSRRGRFALQTGYRIKTNKTHNNVTPSSSSQMSFRIQRAQLLLRASFLRVQSELSSLSQFVFLSVFLLLLFFLLKGRKTRGRRLSPTEPFETLKGHSVDTFPLGILNTNAETKSETCLIFADRSYVLHYSV